MGKSRYSRVLFLREHIEQFQYLFRTTETLKEKFTYNKKVRIENMVMDCSENPAAFQKCTEMMDSILVDLSEKIKLYENKLLEL